MAFPTIGVLDKDSAPQTINTLPAAGQALKANSLSVVVASDDDIQAKLGIVTETAPASDTASSGINGRLQRLAQNVTTLIGRLPAALGIQTAANSLSITHASNDAVVAATGAPGDAAYTTGNGTLISLLKNAVAALASLVTAAQDNTTDSPVIAHTPADVIPFTPTLDTAGAYAANDVLFSTVALTGVTRANDLRAVLMSMTVVDKSKQKPAFSIFFYKTNVTSAAANAANNLSDADAVNYMGHISVAAADYKDLANNSFACYKSINLLLEAASASTSVYMVGVLDAGTPTFAAGDLVLGFGVVQS